MYKRQLYPTPAAPGYFVVTANWDGQWYHEIADLGYPVPLPTGPDGAVQQNPWAFYPVFPMLTRALMWLTRGDFYVVGSTVSLVVGAVAVVLMFRLVDDAVGRLLEAGAGPLSVVVQRAFRIDDTTFSADWLRWLSADFGSFSQQVG